MRTRRLLFIIFVALGITKSSSSKLNARSPAAAADSGLFAKYAVATRFRGVPVTPKLKTKEAHLFRTRIRQGAAKGVGFADHYSVPVWGCGSGCLSFAIVDAITGSVYLFPFTVSQANEAGEPLTFHRNSSAMHIIGSLNEKHSADRWYLWDGKKLNLVSEKRALLIDDSSQTEAR